MICKKRKRNHNHNNDDHDDSKNENNAQTMSSCFALPPPKLRHISFEAGSIKDDDEIVFSCSEVYDFYSNVAYVVTTEAPTAEKAHQKKLKIKRLFKKHQDKIFAHKQQNIRKLFSKVEMAKKRLADAEEDLESTICESVEHFFETYVAKEEATTQDSKKKAAVASSFQRYFDDDD